MIYAKKVKKKCSVTGCKCLESFAISRSRSETGLINICASCLAEALSRVDECRKEYELQAEKNVIPALPTQLFYHPPIPPIIDNTDESASEGEEVTAEGASDTADTSDTSDTADTSEAALFVCEKCGKGFETLRGLNSHYSRVHGEGE